LKVVGRDKLEKFMRSHADIVGPLSVWICEVEDAQWEMPNDIKKCYAPASFLKNDRVVFNIKGTKYRLDVKVSYNAKVVLIMRIGTHAEYRRWKF